MSEQNTEYVRLLELEAAAANELIGLLRAGFKGEAAHVTYREARERRIQNDCSRAPSEK